MLTLCNFIMILGSECVMVVPMLLCFTVNGRLQCCQRAWNLLYGEDALRTGRLGADVQQLARIRLQHDDICSGL